MYSSMPQTVLKARGYDCKVMTARTSLTATPSELPQDPLHPEIQGEATWMRLGHGSTRPHAGDNSPWDSPCGLRDATRGLRPSDCGLRTAACLLVRPRRKSTQPRARRTCSPMEGADACITGSSLLIGARLAPCPARHCAFGPCRDHHLRSDVVAATAAPRSRAARDSAGPVASR